MTLFMLPPLMLPLPMCRLGFCDVGDAMLVMLLPDDILSVLPLCGISLTVSRRKLDFRPAASLTNTGDLVITGCSICTNESNIWLHVVHKYYSRYRMSSMVYNSIKCEPTNLLMFFTQNFSFAFAIVTLLLLITVDIVFPTIIVVVFPVPMLLFVLLWWNRNRFRVIRRRIQLFATIVTIFYRYCMRYSVGCSCGRCCCHRRWRCRRPWL